MYGQHDETIRYHLHDLAVAWRITHHVHVYRKKRLNDAYFMYFNRNSVYLPEALSSRNAQCRIERNNNNIGGSLMCS